MNPSDYLQFSQMLWDAGIKAGMLMGSRLYDRYCLRGLVYLFPDEENQEGP